MFRLTSKSMDKVMKMTDSEHDYSHHINLDVLKTKEERENREEIFNLDIVKMRKLQRLIRQSQARKVASNPHIGMNRRQIRLLKIEEDILLHQQKYIDMRLQLSTVCKANRFVTLGNELELRRELTFGYPIDRRDLTTGRTLLHEASACGHYHIVHMLCHEYRANTTISTLMGSTTALHLAVDGGYRQIASLLITFGADVNAKDRRECIPLHYVKKLGVAKLLFRYPVIANSKNIEGLTPLEYFLKNTPVEEQDTSLEIFLQKQEELAIAEDNRRAHQLHNNIKEKEKSDNVSVLKRVISENSTIKNEGFDPDDPENRGRKERNNYTKLGPKEQHYHLDRPAPVQKKLKPWEKGVHMPKHRK